MSTWLLDNWNTKKSFTICTDPNEQKMFGKSASVKKDNLFLEGIDLWKIHNEFLTVTSYDKTLTEMKNSTEFEIKWVAKNLFLQDK